MILVDLHASILSQTALEKCQVNLYGKAPAAIQGEFMQTIFQGEFWRGFYVDVFGCVLSAYR